MLQLDKYSPEEEKIVEEFKKRNEHKIQTPRLKSDQTLFHRLLIARDFDLRNAEAMLDDYLSIWKKYKIEDVKYYSPPKHMDKYFPSNFLGYDKNGCCVRYIDFGAIDLKGLDNLFEYEEVMQYIVHYLESDVDRATEQTRKLGKQVSQIRYIINLENMSLMMVTYKRGLEFLHEYLLLFQVLYAERMVALYFINASFYFNILFSILKHVASPRTHSKCRTYGKTGWKEDLLEAIDADVLPKFLGGTRTDPDGNPRCNTFIVHAKRVPQELYKTKKRKSISQEEGVKNMIINRLSSSEIVVYVYEQDSSIEWEFHTKSGDIGFALLFKDNCQIVPKTKELLPKQKIDTVATTQTGVYKCEKIGAYVLVFDNSHSWLHSKEIYYKIRVVKPQEN